MSRKIAALLVALVIATTAPGRACLAQESNAADSLSEALTGGKAGIALRYRYEHVSQDSFAEDANASTLRMRLNYRTGDWRGWSGFGEFDYIQYLGLRDFNSGGGTSPARTEFPVVADPRGADLNQFYVDYTGWKNARLRLGRQRILLDNHRFVGHVGWRQNEQTFDGVSVTYDPTEKSKFFYSYINRVNRIFGERVPAGINSVNTHLLHGDITVRAQWRLIPYFYYIDNDDVPTFSSKTAGVRLTGKVPFAERSLSVTAEYATQSDAGNAPLGFRADYAHLLLDVQASDAFNVGLGFEMLGGDADNAGEQFRTPLATLHAFQGWADQFLTTPDAGINDIYGLLTYRIDKWKLTAVYHDLSAQDGSADWGTELDISLGRNFANHYGIVLKGAYFNADDTAYTDTTKLWLQLTADF